MYLRPFLFENRFRINVITRKQFDAAQTPTKNTEDMPGLPGSDERNEAIMNRIKERVADMKLKDEWRNDDDDFGKNPLRNVAITEVMFEQLKVIRPFESFSDFILTLCLLMFTTGNCLGNSICSH